MEREVNISNLLKKDSNKIDLNIIDWDNIDGKEFTFNYDEIIDKAMISKHDKKTQYVWVDYKDIKDFKIHINNLKNCHLGRLIGKITSEFKIEIGQVFKDEKRDLEIIEREYRKKIRKDRPIETNKWYKYRCNKCGYEGWTIESELVTRKPGCARCAGQDVFVGYNDIPTAAPWMIPFFPGGEEQARQYTKCSGDKIRPRCPICGKERNKDISIAAIYTTHSMGCPYCGDGIKYPEKFMKQLLEQVLKNNFIHQLTKRDFKWIGKYKYDFYFIWNGKAYIIETDGGFYKNDNKMSGQTKEESKAIDDLKDELAKKHNIEVIRIDCYESNLNYIKEKIEESELKDLFDLSKIDWAKCETFALSNLVKKACEYKKNNPELTTKEIGEKLGLTDCTINKYLKKGNALKWCEYDPKQEHKRRVSKSINVFKNGIFIEQFESARELERQSLAKFGVQLNHYSISKVCNGKRNSHFGYQFKLVN